MDWIQQTSRGVSIRVKILPRAPVSSIEGIHGDALKIRLDAPPVDGKANAALLRFIARKLGIPPRSLAILIGEMSRNKTILVEGVDFGVVRERLLQGN